jgi:hypothetical protein
VASVAVAAASALYDLSLDFGGQLTVTVNFHESDAGKDNLFWEAGTKRASSASCC